MHIKTTFEKVEKLHLTIDVTCLVLPSPVGASKAHEVGWFKVFHGCRQLPCNTQVPDRSMLVFQAGLKLTRVQHFMPGLGDAPGSNLCCPKCGKHFSTTCWLKRHLAIHTGNYQYHCQVCGRGFASTNSLKGHLVQHTGVKAFVCHICHKKFSYSSSLRTHINQFHSSSDSAPP